MMFMPMFSPTIAAPAGITMVAGVGEVSVGFEAEPVGDAGSLSAPPTGDVTWLGIGTGIGPLAGFFVVFLDGDQTGYFTGKTISVDADSYLGSSLLLENYDGFVPGATLFAWPVINDMVDAAEYTITVT